VYVAFVLAPTPDRLYREVDAHEEIMLIVQDDSELAKLVVTQQAKLEFKNETIIALTTVQKTLGGFSAIVLALYLFLAYRRLSK